jgi:hypothetical protein
LLASGCGAAQGPADGAGTPPGNSSALAPSSAQGGTAGSSTTGNDTGLGAELVAPSVATEQFDAAALSAGEPSGAADPNGGAWRIIEVPAASNQPEIVHSPLGWLALSRRSLGDPRSPSAWQSVLYRSLDGVHWQSIPLDPGHDDLQLSALAYGAGHYVMLGTRTGAKGVSWSSSDGEHWTEAAQPNDSVNLWGRMAFAGGYFFGLGFQYLGVSETGESWRSVRVSNVQAEAVAFGNGHYLLVGSGPNQISEDGLRWRESFTQCGLPGACITDPSGRVSQSIQYNALFAEGRFFTDQLSSADGTLWEAMPERFPSSYAGGRFLGKLRLSTLESWTSDGDVQTLRVSRPARAAVTASGRALTSIGVLDREAPLPDSVSVEFEDGLDCETATCLVVDHRLLLVPPPGTPALTDRVPRGADGSALLSAECPVSSMIFCADYAARTGCECRPDAPSAPAACNDVSQYQCAGAFTPQGDEWRVDEVAQAGCSCDAVDPNQPPSFGLRCSEGGSECAAPLACLPIDSLPSFGPPPEQRRACTSACNTDADCPTWQATGFCTGAVQLRCSQRSCQPRSCDGR